MDTSSDRSTANSSPNNIGDVREAMIAKPGRRWLRIILTFLLFAIVAWGGWKLLGPEPDLRSTINVEEILPDGDSVGDREPLVEGSLLSRIDQATIDAAKHPFDPLLAVAEKALQQTDETVTDYTAIIVSQVRIKGKLLPEQKVACKIRHPRTTGEDQSGLSVYMKFLGPASSADQEVIWVEGQNDGNLIAHTTGLMNLARFHLKPNSMLAMRNSRHPITEIGFRNLMAKIVEQGSRDRKYGECEVTVKRNIGIDGRKCVMLEVMHPVQREHFEFHIARIYLDQEFEIPIAYEGFSWPEEEGGEPVLEEKYFYTELKLNVGLQDSDFDPSNPAYDYPAE